MTTTAADPLLASPPTVVAGAAGAAGGEAAVMVSASAAAAAWRLRFVSCDHWLSPFWTVLTDIKASSVISSVVISHVGRATLNTTPTLTPSRRGGVKVSSIS